MALLTVQAIVPAGLAPTYAAAAGGGDTVADDGKQRTFLHVKNAGGAPINVTIAKAVSSLVVGGLGEVTVADIVVAVPATTGEKVIGPFSRAYLQNTGLVNISYSGVTSVTVAAVSLRSADGLA